MMVRLLCLTLLLLIADSALAGPRVDVVIGDKAPALETLAAEELASQLKRVYNANVTIGSTPPANAEHIIFVGSPHSNANMTPFADSWPSGDKQLSDQGHLLRSVTHNNKPALLIGGGSPVATYWAVAEYGHHLGIRSMLFGDLDPVAPPAFTLQGLDIVMEPSVKAREWRFANLTAWDSGAWGLDEYRAVFRQLAKLKFNRVSVSVGASQPFVDFEFQGIQKQTGELWGGRVLYVSGDTLGRKAFGGARVFENPSFSGAKNYDERMAAGQKLLRGLIDAGHELGLTMILSPQVRESPPEFASRLDSDANRLAFVKTQWLAYLKTYPRIDGLDLPIGVLEMSAYPPGLADRALRVRPDGREIELSVHDETDEETISWPVLFTSERRNISTSRLHLSLGSQVHLLPELRHSLLHSSLADTINRGFAGFVFHSFHVGDLDLAAYWLSRGSFSKSWIGFDRACSELLTSVCGNEVDSRVTKAFQLIEQSAELIADSDTLLGIPTADFLASTAEDRPTPECWEQVRNNYLNAMNEMYRANTRAREGGRAYTLYLARRCEFAFEYMNFAEAARKAGIAERKGDRKTQIAELEQAIESLNNALNALAAVARSNSDRGLIAVLNEYGYRPLKKKLAEAEEAATK
jgi:hypothetical protein